MLKVPCIFSLERRLPGLSSCHIWSFFCEADSTRVPFHPWLKYEWSCCQTGTEVLAVSAASAGRMSKRSVWINDFSRGLIGTDRQTQGHCSVSVFSSLFYKDTFWGAGYKNLLSDVKILFTVVTNKGLDSWIIRTAFDLFCMKSDLWIQTVWNLDLYSISYSLVQFLENAS